uniref:Retrotransposon Copia-like N-terminal domain-containing protein n=1 Tax=Cannabis sativa TaxID=3483 RepID=A0A803PMY8_CANSA
MATDRPEAPENLLPNAAAPAALPNNNLLPLNLRLDRSNYPLWRSLVLAAVRAYNLDGHLLGTNPQPQRNLAGNTPNPAFQQWIRLDQFIMHWLMNSISEAMLAHVIHCQTSAEIWTVLNQLFATRSRARLLQIRGLLQSTKKGSFTIDDYFLKMKQYADSLAAAEQPISDDDLILYILGGLGSEYESVVVNLTLRIDNLTLQEVQFMLHCHEMRLNQLTTDSLTNIQANLANTNMPPQNRGGYQGNSSRGYRAIEEAVETMAIEGEGETDQSASYVAELAIWVSNVIIATNDTSQAWYLDSGATHHISNTSETLTNSKDYKGKAKVVVGLYRLQVPHSPPTTQPVKQPPKITVKPAIYNFTTSSNPVHDKSKTSSQMASAA